ncbi:MAG: hypothetical protein ABDI20_03465 [Candidatus Bipolaricaulaceae bacterium]
MPLVPLLFAAAAVLFAWAAHGFPWDPRWAPVLLPLGFWGAAALRRTRRGVHLGFLGLVALAGAMALAGSLEAGLGVMGLALMAWDSADLLGWRGEGRELRRVMGRGCLRSALVAGTGCALGLAAARLRLRLPFWGLLGVVFLAWLAFWAWTRALQERGGEARGNRSESGPMK